MNLKKYTENTKSVKRQLANDYIKEICKKRKGIPQPTKAEDSQSKQ